MPTICFIHPAEVFDFEQLDPDSGEGGVVVQDSILLRQLDGLQYTDELFADYIADGDKSRAIADAGISGGVLEFSLDRSPGQLLAITKYTLERTLTSKEVETLKEYTLGQWSDGIGSNFFQERMSQGLAPQILVVAPENVLTEQQT